MLSSQTCKSIPALLLLAVSVMLGGCGASVYQPSKMANWGVTAPTEINDEDIEKAFEARPQMPDQMTVAFFSFDPQKNDEIEKLLGEVSSVKGVYKIPGFLVDGSRRYDDMHRPYSHQGQAPPPSIKQLRLLAARARCDVLLVFDYGYRVVDTPNAWLATAPLIVPIFAAPWMDTEAESYLDVYAIDTRNGYLYGQLDNSHKSTEENLTIYEAGRGRELVDDQWELLQVDALESLVGLVKEERKLALASSAPGQNTDMVKAAKSHSAQSVVQGTEVGADRERDLANDVE